MLNKHLFSSIFIVLVISTLGLIIQANTAMSSDCMVMSDAPTDLEFLPNQLIYLRKQPTDNGYGILASTHKRFRSTLQGHILISKITPDGSLISTVTTDEMDEYIFVTNNAQGSTLFTYKPDQSLVNDFVWLGNDRYLTIRSGPRFEVTAYSIVNLETGKITFAYPPPPTWLQTGTPIETEPLLPDEYTIGIGADYFNVSPDGKFIRLVSKIYDLETKYLLELKNLEGDLWSSTSDSLAVLKRNAEIDLSGQEAFYIYSLKEDATSFVTSIDVQPNEEYDLLQNSWSPNQELAVLWRWYESNPDGISILNVTTGENRDICLTNYQIIEQAENGESIITGITHPNFAWSLDSRYLALYGVLQGETDRETGSVYIYDTLEDQIYEVYRGQADIVGWAVSPDAENQS